VCVFYYQLLIVFFDSECWEREYTKRPSFVEIVADIKAMQSSEFCHSTSEEEFRSLQTLWKGEIQKKFVELKKMELVS